MRIILLVLLSAGCSSIPVEELSGLTPEDCRAYGVAVADGTPVTGTIVRSVWGLSHTLERECNAGHANISFSGCAKPVERTGPGLAGWRSATNEYEIWYSDNLCVPEHEACHALYEEVMHTDRFDIRTYTGDRFAACPSHRLTDRGPFRR